MFAFMVKMLGSAFEYIQQMTKADNIFRTINIDRIRIMIAKTVTFVILLNY